MTIHTWQPGDFERPCGGCTLCCKLPIVPSMNKPAGVWCKHCNIGRGCKIYDTRPDDCESFMCLWKVMKDFPPELRPDKCKVIWQLVDDGKMAVAVTEYPKALNTIAHKRLIENFRNTGIAVQINVLG